MFQALFFFHNFLQNSLQNFFLNFFYNFTQIKTKSFEGPKSIRNYEKNNAWNIRRLVDESFVPLTQRIILKIVGFLDFRTTLDLQFQNSYKYRTADLY